jgi:hypothetical protein
MFMTPLGGLVGSGIPPLAIGSGTAAVAMAALGVGLLTLGAVVMVLARRGGRP